ncbi:MAG: EamA family transporter [Alphaproteobacteria bacterium]|nr:EamA family transporter [Alphaproteobacteria bacterium]
MVNIHENSTVRLYVIALVAVLLYGLTPLFTKIAVGSTDGVTVGALRAIVAVPVASAMIYGGRMPLPWRGNDKWLLFISGAGGLAAFPLLFSWGVQLTTAGHAAAGTASGAVMAGIFGAWINRRWPSLYWWAGIAVGLTGALLLIWEAVGFDVEGVTWQGDVLVFAGMFSGVVGYIAGARLTRTAGATAVTLWSVCVAAILVLPVIIWHSGWSAILSIDIPSWGAIIALAWGTTIGAYILWNRAIADGGIARIGSLQLLQPVIGISLAPLLLSEPFTLTLALATAVTLIGVALIQRG